MQTSFQAIGRRAANFVIRQRPSRVFGSVWAIIALLTAAPAEAASLQPVNDWGADGVPSTASMYIYVPDQLADNPPILVLAHYCSGTAGAVFSQAKSGGIVDAADQYGFIMVVPQTTNNCWDVGSTKSLTHDGGGETQAVAQMVEYAITQYDANPDRVYVTGDSSGGMMTQALLAVYPDIFKGGSAFAGVPAGCWAVGDPDGSWSNQCAGGQVTHTAQEWGDLARAMYPEYVGHRPRVQLFHGDADTTINYNNFTEAIKQWTNLLGLGADPTTTTTVTLGSHQATRQQWENDCGYVVLDAFSSMGGDHGPSDAIFNASFVIPFLALDNTDATDPEIAMCGSGDMGGTGDMGGAGGMGSGGMGSGGMGGAPSAGDGGGASVGDATGSGGVANGGATTNGGGMSNQVIGAGGTADNGGSGATGNTAGATGNTTTTPGVDVSAGGSTQGTPSPTNAEGTVTGGSTLNQGGNSNAAGSSSMLPGAPSPSGTSSSSAGSEGSSCGMVVGKRLPSGTLFLSLLGLLVLGGRRRRAKPSARAPQTPASS